MKYYHFSLLFMLILLPTCSLVEQKTHNKKLHDFAHLMPKTQLHIHLEGSIKPTTIIRLAQKNNITLPFKTAAEFKAASKFKSFEDFVRFYTQIIACIKTPQDYECISYEFGQECARQNIIYSEVIFSMASNCKNSNLDWTTILKALNAGKARAQKEFGITWNWIFDLLPPALSNFTPIVFINHILESRTSNQNVIAMSVSEELVTKHIAQYQNAFDKAIVAHLPIVPHAGEFEGPLSIWNSINICKSSRIDHGVRSIENTKLIQELKQKQICLDICITSNICLGVFPSYKKHPLRKLWDTGLLITINTDDPTLFDIDLNQEYDHLIDDYNFTIDELECISLNGIYASFLSPEKKKILQQKFITEFAMLRKKIF